MPKELVGAASSKPSLDLDCLAGWARKTNQLHIGAMVLQCGYNYTYRTDINLINGINDW